MGKTGLFRIRLFKAVLSLGLMFGLAMTPKLWMSEARTYPLVPVIPGMPELPFVLEIGCYCSMFLLSFIILVSARPRRYILALLFLAVLMILADQSRLQPWFYQYLLMFGALCFYKGKELAADDETVIFNPCRVILVGTYVFSGFHKLNSGFAKDIFFYLMAPLFPDTGTPVRVAGMVAAVAESSFGLALLESATRPFAVVCIVLMHLFILWRLGPFGYGKNSAVWPWNVAMIVLVPLLFWRVKAFKLVELVRPANWYHAVVLLLFFVLPWLSFFGLWDHYLSASLYSDAAPRAYVRVSEEMYKTVPGFARGPAPLVVDIHNWSMKEINVPPYASMRVYERIASILKDRNAEADETVLIVKQYPHWFNSLSDPNWFNASAEFRRLPAR